jgi:hypothetical protein
MTLPDSIGWLEYDADFIGQHHGSVMRDIIAERDQRIESLEQECELLRKHIEVLGGEEPDLKEAA